MKFCVLFCTFLLKLNLIKFCFAYTLDDSVGSGRTFDGIGGLSGGGVGTCTHALYYTCIRYYADLRFCSFTLVPQVYLTIH